MSDMTKPKKGKKKVLIIVLVIAVVLVAVIATAIRSMTSQVAAVVNTVEIQPVQKRDLSDTISLKGTVSGVTQNNVTSKALAEITAVNVQVGFGSSRQHQFPADGGRADPCEGGSADAA